MDLADFGNAVVADPDLELLGAYLDTDEAVVRVGEHVVTVDVDGVQRSSWGDVRGVLVGERRPQLLGVFTRVVGYYSNTRNWNRSKLAELRDRGRGNRDIPA